MSHITTRLSYRTFENSRNQKKPRRCLCTNVLLTGAWFGTRTMARWPCSGISGEESGPDLRYSMKKRSKVCFTIRRDTNSYSQFSTVDVLHIDSEPTIRRINDTRGGLTRILSFIEAFRRSPSEGVARCAIALKKLIDTTSLSVLPSSPCASKHRQ